MNFIKRFIQASRWLFWILIIGSLVIIAFAGFYFYQYFTSRDIILSLKAPQNTLLAAPFDIEVNIQNNTNNFLKDVKLSLVLAEGAALVGENPEKRVLNQSLGDLDKNSTLQERIPIIILKDEQSFKRFEVVISYISPALGLKIPFEQTKSIEIAVREPAIKLDLIADRKVLNNQDFEIEVHCQNISDIDFSDVELELTYPEFFTFKKATPEPSSGNNFWKIGDLIKNSQKETLITVQGKVIGAEKSFFKIDGSLKINLLGQKYLISQKTVDINIVPPPLSLDIILNNQPDYLAFPNDNLRYKINYRNNSDDVGLNDVVIKAKLVGEMFDFASLRSSGFFNSKDNTITWNVANTPSLRLINPGVDGFVEFEIKTKKFYPIKRISDKNFILGVEAEISSPTVPYYVAAERTVGLAELKTKVAGNITINSQASFLKGAWPPKVNRPTNFTIRWTIANYSTDVKNIEIKAFLQSGARWLNRVKSNINTVPIYNERTQEIVWLIDRIPATKGVISSPVEATFQIEVTPSITQIGQRIRLLSETTLRGFDEFANIELKSSAKILDSEVTVVE